MAAITFDLADLFERTFGYKTPAFDPKFSAIIGQSALSPGRKENGAQGSPYYSNDALGHEYYMPVTLTYTDSSQDSELMAGEGNFTPGSGNQAGGSTGVLTKWDLPYPVVSISGRKTIVETPLTSRRGTVKELINIMDYEIIVKGFIISNANEFPEADVTTLRTIYEQNTALSIQCPLTDIFLVRPDRSGSDQVVIRELSFPSINGVKNVRPYQLRMVSDEPFNLVSIS